MKKKDWRSSRNVDEEKDDEDKMDITEKKRSKFSTILYCGKK